MTDPVIGMDGALEIWLIDGQEVRVIPRRVMEMLSSGFDKPSNWREPPPAAPYVERGVVYFIRANGFVKIGRTTNFDNRFAKLQTGSPHPLEVLLTIPGGSRREAEIHADLIEHRYRGEWFHECPEVMAYIEAIDE